MDFVTFPKEYQLFFFFAFFTLEEIDQRHRPTTKLKVNLENLDLLLNCVQIVFPFSADKETSGGNIIQSPGA